MKRFEKEAWDRRLTALMLQDLEAGFAEAVRVYWSQLHIVARNVLDGYHLAEDAVQDGLISAYQDLKRAQECGITYYRWRMGKMRLRSWLYTIIRNKARDCLAESRGELLGDNYLDSVHYINGDRIYYPFEDAMERWTRRNQAKCARRLVGTLSPAQAAVLTQKFFRDDGLDSEDVTYQQIANELDIPLNTVKSHMRRGLERLREVLPPDAGELEEGDEIVFDF